MNPLFAAMVRRLMRRKGITIRQLAAAMKVPQDRVREVRDTGRAPWHWNSDSNRWQQDWLDGIERAVSLRREGGAA